MVDGHALDGGLHHAVVLGFSTRVDRSPGSGYRRAATRAKTTGAVMKDGWKRMFTTRNCVKDRSTDAAMFVLFSRDSLVAQEPQEARSRFRRSRPHRQAPQAPGGSRYGWWSTPSQNYDG